MKKEKQELLHECKNVTQQVTMTTGLRCTEKSSLCTYSTNLWKKVQRDYFADDPGSFSIESNV